MPKINTHLTFARNIIEKVTKKDVKRCLQQNRNEFLVGNIFPDIFSYSLNKKLTNISGYIHGNEGNLTNKLIFDILNVAKEEQDEKLVVFTMGIINHFVLDIKIHQIVCCLSGDYYDRNEKKRTEARYKHIKLETAIDAQVSKRNNFSKELQRVGFLRTLGCVFKGIGIGKYNINRSNRRLIFIDSIILHKVYVYKVVVFLVKIGILNKMYKGLFYADIKNIKIKVEKTIELKCIFNRKFEKKSLMDAFNDAEKESIIRMQAAFGYYSNKITLKECKGIIKGENLSTGEECN